MDTVKLKAPAKINLTLDVLDKRSDGMHNIVSVMQTISLFDDVVIKKTILPGIRIFSNVEWLCDSNNLVYRLAEDILREYNLDCGLTIKLYKRIPIGAGLAGGSSDCATALKCLIKLFDLKLSMAQIHRTCEKYGADVPYCFFGGTMLVKGIGNILKRLPHHSKAVVLLAKPNFFVSNKTKKIFEMFDQKNFSNSHTEKIISAIKNRNIKDIAENFSNSLEYVTANLCPQIKQIKNFMLQNDAFGACMSGSGPTVFGYFENFNIAKKTAVKIQNKFRYVTTFVTRTL